VVGVSRQEKRGKLEACVKLDLYFQTSKSGGVNPPTFPIYFSCRINGLAGIG
jgi:hypothetical protein